jgi:hypothetical protein
MIYLYIPQIPPGIEKFIENCKVYLKIGKKKGPKALIL